MTKEGGRGRTRVPLVALRGSGDRLRIDTKSGSIINCPAAGPSPAVSGHTPDDCYYRHIPPPLMVLRIRGRAFAGLAQRNREAIDFFRFVGRTLLLRPFVASKVRPFRWVSCDPPSRRPGEGVCVCSRQDPCHSQRRGSCLVMPSCTKT